MRIHLNEPSSVIHGAMLDVTGDGKVSPHVRIIESGPHLSRSHRAAYEVKLDTPVKMDGEKRYRPNSGTIGHDGREVWAATWHEWGWFLARIFELDPSAKAGPYVDDYEFHRLTDDQFHLDTEVTR